jgi:hypothetical protein
VQSENPNWKPEYQPHPVNEGQRTLLLENGLIVQLFGNQWYIRRYCPTETMDSKWIVWINRTEGNHPPSWGAAACMCFTAIEEDGFDTAEEALIVAQSTDWEQVDKDNAERYKDRSSKLLTQEELGELINSKDWQDNVAEIKAKAREERLPFINQGFTHEGWVTGAGGDSIYLKELPDYWLGDNDLLYEKTTGLAALVVAQTPLFQLNINSIKVIDRD